MPEVGLNFESLLSYRKLYPKDVVVKSPDLLFSKFEAEPVISNLSNWAPTLGLKKISS